MAPQDKERKPDQSVNRREFIQSASGMIALGGGLFMMASQDGSATVHEAALKSSFSYPWPPASPRRLSAVTHELAARGLAGEHGRAMREATFTLDPADTAGCSADMRYAKACKLVAERAPLRILRGERIVGSATLREAPAHMTPVARVPSTSHTTLGFDRVLRIGYKGLREQIRNRLARGNFETADEAAPVEAGVHDRCMAFRTSATGSYWAEARPCDEYDRPPLTVECWARLCSSRTFNVVVLNRNKDSRYHWELYSWAGSGCFAAYLPGYAPSEIVSDKVITDGRWHYLAMVFEEGRVSLYVDGEPVVSTEVKDAGIEQEGAGGLYFGGYPLESLGADGAIGEVRISRGAVPVATVPASPFAVTAATLGLWQVETGRNGVVLRDRSALQNTAHATLCRGGQDLLESMLICLDAASIWHARHMTALEELAAGSTGADREGYLRVAANLRNVPENPPETFYEAVQSLWFMYAFQRLMGTWSGIGRIDEMLGPYLDRDRKDGRITLDEAREILAHFWIKGCEWIGAFDTRGSGDAQHYQNIVLGGVDADGNEVANEVTYLVLDVVEELHISDFPIAVRINRRTPEKLLRRIAEVQRHGGGIVAVYNEETVIRGLVAFGYPLDEARRFANDGCWEVLIPGKTSFSYSPFDMLTLLHGTLGLHDAETPPPDYPDFESLYAAYLARVEAHLESFHAAADGVWRRDIPAPLVSMFVDDCIEKGRGYYNMGARYPVFAPHAGGLANAAGSLQVIQKLVYQDRHLTLPEFVGILRKDYDGHEPFRRLILNRFMFYGNDDDEADAMVARLFNDYTALAARTPKRGGVLRPAGISTFGREIEWRAHGRMASPDGHRKGEILATNFSPSPGTDVKGPTAVVKSYCKMDLTRVPNGATIELKIHPGSVKDDRGLDALVALLKGFVKLGGFFVHVDVVDSALLLDAQRHPEKYPNLAVRVAGWSARFATLDKDWQDMVIGRTQQVM